MGGLAAKLEGLGHSVSVDADGNTSVAFDSEVDLGAASLDIEAVLSTDGKLIPQINS